jgi:hypothetical protein
MVKSPSRPSRLCLRVGACASNIVRLSPRMPVSMLRPHRSLSSTPWTPNTPGEASVQLGPLPGEGMRRSGAE